MRYEWDFQPKPYPSPDSSDSLTVSCIKAIRRGPASFHLRAFSAECGKPQPPGRRGRRQRRRRHPGAGAGEAGTIAQRQQGRLLKVRGRPACAWVCEEAVRPLRWGVRQ
ncbi:hypothetical protein H8959_011827 [Pygathrix nigripes]